MILTSRDLIELNQFVHGLESEIFIPLFFDKIFQNYRRTEELLNSNCTKNTWTTKGQVLGCILHSEKLMAIDYFGYLKKSYAILNKSSQSHNIQILSFEKIPKDLIYSRSSNRKLAIDFMKNRSKLEYFLRGKYEANSMGQEIYGGGETSYHSDIRESRDSA